MERIHSPTTNSYTVHSYIACDNEKTLHDQPPERVVDELKTEYATSNAMLGKDITNATGKIPFNFLLA